MIKLKNKPDLTIYCQEDYWYKQGDILKAIDGKSGIYIYRLRKVVFYVGASRNLKERAVRFYRKDLYTGSNSNFADLIVDAIRKRSLKGEMKADIFFYPFKHLGEIEQRYIKKLRPVAQAFNCGSRRYRFADKEKSK